MTSKMDSKSIKKINAEVNAGDFSSFNNLSEENKGKVMKNWDKTMKHKYLTQNPVMSEEEFFSILDTIAEGTFNENYIL